MNVFQIILDHFHLRFGQKVNCSLRFHSRLIDTTKILQIPIRTTNATFIIAYYMLVTYGSDTVFKLKYCNLIFWEIWWGYQLLIEVMDLVLI